MNRKRPTLDTEGELQTMQRLSTKKVTVCCCGSTLTPSSHGAFRVQRVFITRS